MARREYLIKLQTPRLAFPRLLVFPYRSKAQTSFLLRRLRPSVGLQGPEQEIGRRNAGDWSYPAGLLKKTQYIARSVMSL
jgi:hypothetical protein